MQKYKWMKIDTASIMFTSLSSKRWGRTFRTSANLTTGDINPELLTKAVADLIPRFPSVYSCLKKGFFWNYQEQVDTLPEIMQEHSRPVLPITYRGDGRPDFRVLYYKNRITVESAHHVTDGKGMGVYFGALLERYTELCENPDAPYSFEKTEDIENAFKRYAVKGGEKAADNSVTAYQLETPIEKGFLQLIFMSIPTEQIKAEAKGKDMSVTEFLSAALILGTVRQATKPITLPIVIGIPVNLRRFFPTDSVRNFTIQVEIIFDTKGRTDWSFDEICEEIKGQLKKKLEVENLQKMLNRYSALSSNPVVRIVPNFIKLPVIRMMQHKSHKANTTIMTNTGEAEMNEKLKGKVVKIEGVNGDTSGYGLVCTCSSLSYNGMFNLCFSLCSHDTTWPMECVRVLSGLGLDIRIESSHGNGVNKNEM